MRDLMRRQAQRAVVIDLPPGVEMRYLDHPAHQHQGDAQNAEQRGPAGMRS